MSQARTVHAFTQYCFNREGLSWIYDKESDQRSVQQLDEEQVSSRPWSTRQEPVLSVRSVRFQKQTNQKEEEGEKNPGTFINMAIQEASPKCIFASLRSHQDRFLHIMLTKHENDKRKRNNTFSAGREKKRVPCYTADITLLDGICTIVTSLSCNILTESHAQIF